VHDYIEIRFRKRGRPYRVARQVEQGFEFDEPDPPARAIHLGFRAYDDGTKYRLERIRRIKGWRPERFDIRVSVEDGSLVLRGDDRYALPEGWYQITADVDGAKVRKVDRRRVEVPHDGHGVVTIDLALDERTIDVDLARADADVLRLLEASVLDGRAGTDWVADAAIRPTRRACALNLAASLRVTPTKSGPLLHEVERVFLGLDDRVYARVTPRFYERVQALSESPDRPVYAEGHPHAPIHEALLTALAAFEPETANRFRPAGLWSFRAEGSPSLQMVIARPETPYRAEFADLDLDLGNPLQDAVGLVVHLGELLDGKPTNHLDLWKKLRKQKRVAPYLCYTVASAAR
jgi:hypothetical protein